MMSPHNLIDQQKAEIEPRGGNERMMNDTKKLEYRAFRRGGKFDDTQGPGVYLHSRRAPTEEARLAMAILEKWAMVQGEPDGEDSAGRSKLGLMPVKKVVSRACDIAGTAMDEFRKRGWLVGIPSLDELEDEIKEREDRRENV